MNLLMEGVLIGVIATIGMDICAAFAKHILGLPTANWALVGRWFGHMPRGAFMHHPVAAAAPIRNELMIGWMGHYAIGITYGIAYLYVVKVLIASNVSLASALIFGVVTLIAPWLIMQPAMGAGAFASRAPCPGVMRAVNASMHMVFGASMYIGCLFIQ